MVARAVVETVLACVLLPVAAVAVVAAVATAKKNSGNPHTTGKIGAEHAVIAPPISKAKKIKRRSRKRFPA